jgi:hypothetical protein
MGMAVSSSPLLSIYSEVYSKESIGVGDVGIHEVRGVTMFGG